MNTKNNIVIFNPDEKEALLYTLFGKELELQQIMKKIIVGFERTDYKKIVQGKRDEKTILELLEDDEEKYMPVLIDFYKDGGCYKDDHPRRRKLKAGIFYTICKLLLVRCNCRKGFNKLMYAATFPDLPDEFAPLYLFRLGSIYIEQGMILEAGDILSLAAHRCKIYNSVPVMFNLELLILYQIFRVNTIKGNLIVAGIVLDDLKRKLNGKENIIFSSLEGYYYRVNGELDKGISTLNEAYLKYRENKVIQKTYFRSWFNVMYQLAFCYLNVGNKIKATSLMAEASSILEDFNYRNNGYYENILGLIKMTGDDRNLDESLAHFQKAYNYFSGYSDYRNMARSKRNMGKLFVETNNYPEALRSFNQSLDYDLRTQIDIGIVHTLLGKIDLRVKLIQYYKAREYMQRIDEIKLPRKHYLNEEIKKRKELLESVDIFKDEIIGESKAISDIKREIEFYTITDDPILLTGEKGVGKSLIAENIHEKSARKGDFKHIMCSLIPSEQFESEIFGQVHETSSGKYKENIGFLEKSNHGTAFFDEVFDLSVQFQIKLMRFIDEKTILPIGDNKEKKLDVKLIFSTSKKIDREIAHGNINTEFYDKIGDFLVNVPPLRERREDIKELAEFFYVTECKKLKKNLYGIKSEALSFMKDYSWPGNTKELKKTIKRCLVKCASEEPITRESIISVLDSSQARIGKKAKESLNEEKDKVAEEQALRITDSHKIINDVFRIIQERGPTRKSKVIERCPDAEKSFHHWINILKDKYEVIEESKAGNYNVYTAASLSVLEEKFRSGELEKAGNYYSVVEQ